MSSWKKRLSTYTPARSASVHLQSGTNVIKLFFSPCGTEHFKHIFNGPFPASSRLFSDLSNKHYNFYSKLTWKISIHFWSLDLSPRPSEYHSITLDQGSRPTLVYTYLVAPSVKNGRKKVFQNWCQISNARQAPPASGSRSANSSPDQDRCQLTDLLSRSRQIPPPERVSHVIKISPLRWNLLDVPLMFQSNIDIPNFVTGYGPLEFFWIWAKQAFVFILKQHIRGKHL